MTTDILALTSEAAVLVQRGKVVYANTSALGILGADCVGKSMKALFGADIAGTQAASFIAGTAIAGREYIVRVTRAEGGLLVFFACPPAVPELLNDPFLCSIRNSLMNIGMAADRIRDQAEKTGDALILSCLSSMTRSYYRMIRMTSNASLVLGIADGNIPFASSTVNLSFLCRSILEAAEMFDPEPELYMDLGGDISLNADPALIKQLILNLISNCLVHAEGCTKIKIGLTDARDSVILSVTDDGCGIEPDALNTVFDRYRHGFDMASMNSGVGLGLTIVRCIAQMHGGTLLLESRPGQGTTVRVSFGKKPSAVNLCAPGRNSPISAKEVLIGLSDSLPAEHYSEKYMD